MHPILTEQQIDKLDDIFDTDKASALRRMLKPGLFRKSTLPIDAVDKKGKGLLSIAAFNNAVKCMKVLLDAGADINAGSPTCPTPLHYALSNNHTECARLLLERGASPDAEPSPGYTPLHEAATASPECLNLILRYGVRINVREEESGMTPLMKCARYGLPACAEILLRHGANPDIRNNEGQTALEIASKRGAIGIARILKKAVEA